MARKETLTVIVDTSPIIFLIQLNRLHVLGEIFKNVLISIEVFKEITNKEQRKILEDAIKKGWIKKVKAPKLDILHGLDIGEASSISLALQYDKSLLIIDDLEARNFASYIGLDVIGTIGVLLLAKEKKLIKSIRELLFEKSNLNLWLSQDLLDKVLKMAKE